MEVVDDKKENKIRVENELKSINEIYDQIIYNIENLLNKFHGVSDPTTIYVLIKYMIKNGYFTNNNLMDDLSPNIVKLEDRYLRLETCGLLLPFGCISCRHSTNFLYSIYNSLGYINSQLFVYSPNIKIKIYPKENAFISSEQLQEKIDYMISLVDVESLESIALNETFDDCTMELLYTKTNPESIVFGNHTLNIVLGKDDIIYIFDISNGLIGIENWDDSILNMYSANGIYQQFYIKEPLSINNFSTGLSLLNDFFSPNAQEELKKIEKLEKECEDFISEIMQYKNQNSKYYDMINNSVQKILTKIN